MKAFPGIFSLPHRSKFLTQILILAFLLNAPDKIIVAQIRSGGVQLRTAVASNSDAELQKVEASMAGTESGALARLLRGYLRLQAKDYPAAISLLSACGRPISAVLSMTERVSEASARSATRCSKPMRRIKCTAVSSSAATCPAARTAGLACSLG